MSVHRVSTRTGQRRYEVRFREGERQRAKRFILKADAEAWDREVQRRRQLGPLAIQQLTVRGPTLAKWIRDRWSPEHASRLEAKTRARYANSYEVHIEPALGHLALQELTVGRLRSWQADLIRDGVSAHAIMKARTVLSSVLRHAAESEAIQANPLQLVRPPRGAHHDQVEPLSPAQVELIRRRLRPRDAAIVSVLAYAGLRPGELRALRWGDIRTNTILVQRAANPDGTVKATKTRRGVRPVRLLEPLATDLAALRAHTGGHGRDLVFPAHGTRNQAMTEEAWGDWRSKAWTPARRAVVDFAATPYHLRHSFASLLLAEGRSVHYVAGELGHDATLTLSTYGHLIAEYADAGNIDVVAEIHKARQVAAETTAAPDPVRQGPGAAQRAVLALIAGQGGTDVALASWNERRAGHALQRRGYVTVTGTGPGQTFTITAAGRRYLKEQR